MVSDRWAIQKQKNKLYSEYLALQRQIDSASAAVEAARLEVKKANDAVLLHARPSIHTLMAGYSRANPEEKLKQCERQLALDEAALNRLYDSINETKREFDKLHAEHKKISKMLGSSIYPEQRPDPNADGVIRQVNMRLVNGNPNYLKNVFGSDAEIIVNKKTKKIDVFFESKSGRSHAVINSGGNVSYPRG